MNEFLRAVKSGYWKGDTRKTGNFLRLLHHFDINTGKTRQKRSDRRRNIFKVLDAIIPYLDLEDMAWGNPYKRKDGTIDFFTYGMKELVKRTGLAYRTIQNALLDLEAAGYMKIKRNGAIGKDGELIRYYSIRKFKTRFFTDLGFKKSNIDDIKRKKRNKREKAGFYSIANSGLSKLKKVFGAITLCKSKKETKKTGVHALSPIQKKKLLDQATDMSHYERLIAGLP